MASAWISTLAILFTLSGLRAESVSQPDDQVTVTEGDPLTVKCTYSFSLSPYMFWYVQYPNQGLQILLKYFAGDNLVKGSFGFVAEFNKSQTSFHLKKRSALGSDSAVYFCAGSISGGYQWIFGSGTRLLVRPDIQNATPAVYQLENRKSDTRICLFTDFDSKTNVSDVLNDTVISSKNTVLDMKATNSKSNGVLFWSNTTKSGCEGISDEINYYSSAGIPCDAKLIEKGFETDINLNSQNLSVIALRILLLKVVGFNLLMTLRLWSS